MSEYKIAVQNKFRFPSNRGALTVEQLFDLPLKSQGGFDLDTVARAVNAELKTMDTESFVEDPTANPRKETLTTMLNIVKDVIKTKQDENASRLDKARKAEARTKILDAISAKEDQKLSEASLEDLKKQLAELG